MPELHILRLSLTLILLDLLSASLSRVRSTPTAYDHIQCISGSFLGTCGGRDFGWPTISGATGRYVAGRLSAACRANIAKIDPRPYQTVVDQDRANLAVAKAQLEKDKSNLAYTKINSERLANLSSTNAVSKDAADIAKNNYNQAVAQIAYDEALINRASLHDRACKNRRWRAVQARAYRRITGFRRSSTANRKAAARPSPFSSPRYPPLSRRKNRPLHSLGFAWRVEVLQWLFWQMAGLDAVDGCVGRPAGDRGCKSLTMKA